MKLFMKLCAAAAIAVSATGERAEAQFVDIGTTFGAFNIASLGVNEENVTTMFSESSGAFASETLDVGDVTENFVMTRGSFTDIVGPTPATAPFTPLPLGPLDGAWSASFEAAKRYAFAFAEVLNTTLFAAETQGGMNNGFSFAPDYPAGGFAGAAYAFAWSAVNASGAAGSGLVNAVVVLFDGQTVNVVDGIPTASDTPNVSARNTGFTMVPGGPEENFEIFYANSTLDNPTPVPEIDGPVLVQVGFALGGLYLLMLGRRRRDDEVIGTPLAA